MNATSSIRGLYVIADTGVINRDLTASVYEAIEGGAGAVQYRDKGQNAVQRLNEASALRALCNQHGIIFIVNDDVELALQSGADGVHLGRDDAAIKTTRARLGPRAIIGISCYNEFERARYAVAAGADYLAFGSFYTSSVKPDAVNASDTLLTQAKQEFSLPVVAIGGITPENGPRLIAAGADALAVISGLFSSNNVRGAAGDYAALFSP